MYSLSCSRKLDGALMAEIFEQGFSRIPVWDESGSVCLGLLYAKDLVLLRPEQNTPVMVAVSHFKREGVMIVDSDDNLEKALKMFISNRNHFALVRSIRENNDGKDSTYEVCGLITMEDILGFILAEEIGDDSHELASGFHTGLLDSSTSASLPLMAVAAHLLANVPPFRPHRFSVDATEAALRVETSLIRTGENEEKIFVSRKQPLDAMVLVFQGSIRVLSGEDGLSHTYGPWDWLGEKALTVEGYMADFTATVQPNSTCLRISRSLYQNLANGFFRTVESKGDQPEGALSSSPSSALSYLPNRVIHKRPLSQAIARRKGTEGSLCSDPDSPRPVSLAIPLPPVNNHNLYVEEGGLTTLDVKTDLPISNR